MLTPFYVRRGFRAFWNVFKKILVLAASLATAAMVVASVCYFITGSIKLSVGVTLAIVGIGLLVWGLKSFALRSLTFVRTFMVVLILGLFVITASAYLGIRSPTDIRDIVIAVLHGESEQFPASVDAIVERAELWIVKVVTQPDEDGGQGNEESTEPASDTEYVYINGGVLVGVDGHRITLRNNSNAGNPTWDELKAFLATDKTDEHPYDFLTFVCADFAEMLHNNAETAGIRAAFVTVNLGPCSYYATGGGHALNAFETTDRGLVYIDCTSPIQDMNINADKVVDVELGKEYIPKSIFPEPGWQIAWESMGVVTEIEVVQG